MSAVNVTETSHLTVRGLPPAPSCALARRLTLPNPRHSEAVRFGRWTGGIPRTLTYYSRSSDGAFVIPRGALGELRQVLEDAGLEFSYEVCTTRCEPVDFDSSVVLTEAQEGAVTRLLGRRLAQLTAPAGSGKTHVALQAIARRRQPTLWLTHTRELAYQTRERAIELLNLEPAEIGLLGDGKKRIGERLTIALVQTLARGLPAELPERIGHLIVDECHHTPAAMMAGVVAQLPAHYVLGLSATPFRRDGLDRVITFYCGPVAATIEKRYLPERLLTPTVERVDTGVAPHGDSFTQLVTQLVNHSGRNRLIVAQAADAMRRGRRVLILSERVEHVELLTDALAAQSFPVAALHGGVPRAERDDVRRRLDAGELAGIVATGQLIGEGWDCPSMDTLILATPVSYRGRLIQYLGRVSRTAPGKSSALVLDFADDHPMLWSSWSKRREVYDGGSHANYGRVA